MTSDNSKTMNWKEDIIVNKLGGKRDWTDEERSELCRQLDLDLEKTYTNIPKSEEKDRWTEENWREKMKEHPLFAGYLQEEGSAAIAPDCPLTDGLAQLKFDPEYSTTEEIVENYRAEGNIYFNHKKYNLAILSYTEALKQTVVDEDMQSRLYNNRAACHFNLDNFRSALTDSETVLKINPAYAKAIVRGAKCCYILKRYTDCVSWCDKGLDISSIKKELINLSKQARKDKSAEDAKRRRNLKEAKANESKNRALLKAFRRKKIPVDSSLDDCDMEQLNEKLSNAKVKLNSNGELDWDVAFVYPEHNESDLVEEFNERTRFITQLRLMFNQPAQWDSEEKYLIDRLRLYFTDKNSGKPIPVNTDSTLATVLRDERYPIDCLYPEFLVVVEGSKFQAELLQK